MHVYCDFDAPNGQGPQDQVHWTSIKIQCKCIDLLNFLSKKWCAVTNLAHTQQKSKMIFVFAHNNVDIHTCLETW